MFLIYKRTEFTDLAKLGKSFSAPTISLSIGTGWRKTELIQCKTKKTGRFNRTARVLSHMNAPNDCYTPDIFGTVSRVFRAFGRNERTG